MKLSPAELNYLTAIDRHSKDGEMVSTSTLANEFEIASASVTDMVQKLAEKEYVRYEKYKGVALLPTGQQAAKQSQKNEAIWSTFLSEKLHVSKSEQETYLEELRKLQLQSLVEKVDQLNQAAKVEVKAVQANSLEGHKSHQEELFEPTIEQDVNIEKELKPTETEDLAAHKLNERVSFLQSAQEEKKHPHESENKNKQQQKTIAQLNVGETAHVIGLTTVTSELLQLLRHFNIALGCTIMCTEKFAFDQSIQIQIDDQLVLLSSSLANAICIDR